ncbi:AraC family transcriptional regulator [Maribacter sp. 2307ULW6-5]|uniref:AraC family transcriptional regulator n=1 Tax=Maribacter sp. 2307ULW6-5 TaxID=3386275 RepID=UPI0039BD77F4
MDNSALQEGFLGQKMIVLPKAVKKRLKSNPITSPFYVTDIGYYPNAMNHRRLRKEGAQEYIFIYCTKGLGFLSIKNTPHKVGPNQFFIIPAKTRHEYWTENNDPWSIYWMHFNGTTAQSIYERYEHGKNKNGLTPFESGRIHLFNQIYKLFESDYAAAAMEYANMLAQGFLGSFVYAQLEESETSRSANNVVDQIIAFIGQNLDKSFKAEQISEKFHYSPSYLYTIFKKRTGYSLVHFINLKKVQRACEYLKYSELSIKEIGYHLGFQDPLYFSRLFKKFMGMSPRDYKRQQRN